MRQKTVFKSSGHALAALLFAAVLSGCTATSGPVQQSAVPVAASTPVPDSFMQTKYHVFVSSESPERLAGKIRQMDRNQVIQFLYGLKQADDGQLAAKNADQSVIFVVFGPMTPGTKLETDYTYSRSPQSRAATPNDAPFTDGFFQTVQAGDSTNPVIVINGTFSIYKGKFVYRLFRNGKEVFSRKVEVPNDA